MKVKVIARRWGNSIGVALPKEIVEKERISENEELFIDVHKSESVKVKDFFGLAKGWNIDAQKIKDDLRSEDIERDAKISRFIRNHRNIKSKSKL
ncbi:MAG: AbrB/MazE/SpoVT family DNA-binding domain-containing protein [archaeon]|nr:AbrB/MazE/SpoVT family DNA-binding domain-containing protein [archaeon]